MSKPRRNDETPGGREEKRKGKIIKGTGSRKVATSLYSRFQGVSQQATDTEAGEASTSDNVEAKSEDEASEDEVSEDEVIKTTYDKYERFAYEVAGFVNENVDTIINAGDTTRDRFIRIYGHMREAHRGITGKWPHMANATIEDLIDDMLYAKLVALCMRTSSFLSDKRYSMDKTYLRLNLEKQRVLNTWRHAPMYKKQPPVRFELVNPSLSEALNRAN